MQRKNLVTPAASDVNSSQQSYDEINNKLSLSQSMESLSSAETMQAALVKKIFASKIIKFQDHEDSSAIIGKEVSLVWSDIIEHIALASTDSDIILFNPNKLNTSLVMVGNFIADIDPNLARLEVISSALNEDQTVFSFGDLKGDALPLNSEGKVIYLPINYRDNKSSTSGRVFSQMLNHLLALKSCSVKIYFEDDSTVPADLAKKAAWQDRHKAMLKHVGVSNNITLNVLRHDEVITNEQREQAEAYFLANLIIKRALVTAVKDDVCNILLLKRKELKVNANTFFNVTATRPTNPPSPPKGNSTLEDWAKVFYQNYMNPSTTAEQKIGLMDHWVKLCAELTKVQPQFPQNTSAQVVPVMDSSLTNANKTSLVRG